MHGIESIGSSLLWVWPNRAPTRTGWSRCRCGPADLEALARPSRADAGVTPLQRERAHAVGRLGMGRRRLGVRGVASSSWWSGRDRRGRRFYRADDVAQRHRVVVLAATRRGRSARRAPRWGGNVTIGGREFPGGRRDGAKERSPVDDSSDDDTCYVPFEIVFGRPTGGDGRPPGADGLLQGEGPLGPRMGAAQAAIGGTSLRPRRGRRRAPVVVRSAEGQHPDHQQGVRHRHHGHHAHRGHLAGGGRHRHHEHHAGVGDRAHARDRHPQGARRAPARHPAAVPDRGGSSCRSSAASSACCSASAARSSGRPGELAGGWKPAAVLLAGLVRVSHWRVFWFLFRRAAPPGSIRSRRSAMNEASKFDLRLLAPDFC